MEIEIEVEFVGVKIKAVRNMTKTELKNEGWEDDNEIKCLEFENGFVLYPSRDYEGNGPGILFGYGQNNKIQFTL